MGDYIRLSPPYIDGADDSAKSALFLSLNRNKRSIRLDLKSEGGREALLRLVREYDVVLESFRPGVLDRLGVGYERMREENPGIVYCAISGYGQTGPKREAAGHDMNYLGLIGLLGLTGERGGGAGAGSGPDRRPRRRRADGGVRDPLGAARARRSTRARGTSCAGGLGRRADRRRVDGRRRIVVAGDGRGRHTSPTATVPRRGELLLAGSVICYRPYECADGWVSLGALEPKFWQAWCRGVGREDLIEKQFERPGTEAHAEVEKIFKARSRADWEAFARKHDCCLEPVLELDEALSSDLVREREMVVEIDQPGAERPVRQLGIPVKLGPYAGRAAAVAGAGAGRAHRGGAARRGLQRG